MLILEKARGRLLPALLVFGSLPRPNICQRETDSHRSEWPALQRPKKPKRRSDPLHMLAGEVVVGRHIQLSVEFRFEIVSFGVAANWMRCLLI